MDLEGGHPLKRRVLALWSGMAQVAPANAEPKEKPVRGLELVASTSMAAAPCNSPGVSQSTPRAWGGEARK